MKPTNDVKYALSLIEKNREVKALNYAVNYARYGMTIENDGEELYVQVLYVLNNISHWRGPEATECRGILKSYVKAYKEKW